MIQLSNETKKGLFDISIILLALLGFYLWYSAKDPKVSPEVPPATITTSTIVTAEPKTSATDNDVEITQTYIAEVNGQKVVVPIRTLENPFGTKGVIKQQVDLTPVVQQLAKQNEKNWEVGIGIGVHEGDLYMPLSVERTYSRSAKVDKAIEAEIHLGLEGPAKITGGELKHKWKF